ISRTMMWTWAVPVLGGEPPSAAIRVKSNSGISSLSRGCCKTSSTFIFPSCLL
uniref:Uncharacterized protein n=1 Tax=Meleagris gallopavo TaxID=9103 RepID=A0A803XQB3_MELGA